MARGRLPRSLRPCYEPPPRHIIEIRQPAAEIQAVRILRQPAVPNFGPPEDTLDDQGRVFDFRPHFRFRAVLSPLRLTQWPMPMRFGLHETLGLGRVPSNRVALPTLLGVTPHAGFLSMQQFR